MLDALIALFIQPKYVAPRAEVRLEQAKPAQIEELPLETTISTTEEEKPLKMDKLTALNSCIVYLQEVKDVPIKGDAIDQVPNIPLSEIRQGDILLLNYNGVGHASYVEYRFPRAVWISEANYEKDKYTERAIKFDDKNIVGAMRVDKR